MLLQLKPLFMGEMESLPIDAELDFSGVEFQGIHPFTQPVRVKGEAVCSAGIPVRRPLRSLQRGVSKAVPDSHGAYPGGIPEQ